MVNIRFMKLGVVVSMKWCNSFFHYQEWVYVAHRLQCFPRTDRKSPGTAGHGGNCGRSLSLALSLSLSIYIYVCLSIYLSLSLSLSLSLRPILSLSRAGGSLGCKKKESSHCTCNCEFGAFATSKYGVIGLDCIEADFCKLYKQFCWMIYNQKFYKIYTLLPWSERPESSMSSTKFRKVPNIRGLICTDSKNFDD